MSLSFFTNSKYIGYSFVYHFSFYYIQPFCKCRIVFAGFLPTFIGKSCHIR